MQLPPGVLECGVSVAATTGPHPDCTTPKPTLKTPLSPLGQAEHKIQSAGGPLVLSLERVPKMLGALRHHWCPSAMVVSFKLETDQHILLHKVGGGHMELQWWGSSNAVLLQSAVLILFAIHLLSCGSLTHSLPAAGMWRGGGVWCAAGGRQRAALTQGQGVAGVAAKRGEQQR